MCWVRVCGERTKLIIKSCDRTESGWKKAPGKTKNDGGRYSKGGLGNNMRLVKFEDWHIIYRMYMVAEMVVRWEGLNGRINTKKMKK